MVFLLCLISAICIEAEEGMALYRCQKFEDAYGYYLKKNSKSASDCYMMGAIAYAQESYAKAILLWAIAKNKGGFFYLKPCLDGILRAQEKLIQSNVSNNFVLYNMHNNELLLFWLFIYLCCAALSIYYFYTFKKSSFFLVLLFGSLYGFFLLKEETRLYGVVNVENEVSILCGPLLSYHSIGRLRPGDVIYIMKEIGDWVLVSDFNISGWVLKKNFLIATDLFNQSLVNVNTTSLE